MLYFFLLSMFTKKVYFEIEGPIIKAKLKEVMINKDIYCFFKLLQIIVYIEKRVENPEKFNKFATAKNIIDPYSMIFMLLILAFS